MDKLPQIAVEWLPGCEAMKEMFESLTLRIAEQMTPPPWYDKLAQHERYEWYVRQYNATEQLRRTAAYLFRSATKMPPVPLVDPLSISKEKAVG